MNPTDRKNKNVKERRGLLVIHPNWFELKSKARKIKRVIDSVKAVNLNRGLPLIRTILFLNLSEGFLVYKRFLWSN